MSESPLTPLSESTPSTPPPQDQDQLPPTTTAAATTTTTPHVLVPSSSSPLSSASSSQKERGGEESDDEAEEEEAAIVVENEEEVLEEPKGGQGGQVVREEEDEGGKAVGSPRPCPSPSSSSHVGLLPITQQDEDLVAHELEIEFKKAVEEPIVDHEMEVVEEPVAVPDPKALPTSSSSAEAQPQPSPPPRSTSPHPLLPPPPPPPPPPTTNAVASSSKLVPSPPRPPLSRISQARPSRGPFDDLLDGIDLDDDPFGMDDDGLDPSMDLDDDDDAILPSSQPDERPAALLLPSDLSPSLHDAQHQPSSPPSDFMSMGFTTGGDKKAAVKPVGEDALRRARELMEEKDGEDGEGEGREETLSSKRRRLNTPATMGSTTTSARAGGGGSGGGAEKRLPPPVFGLAAPVARMANGTREDDQDPFSHRPSRPTSRTSSPAPPPPAFEGFKTAGGKGFKPPSRAALIAAAKLLEEDFDAIMGGESEEIFAPVGFASASSTLLPPPPPPPPPAAAPPSRMDSPAPAPAPTPTTNGARTPFSVVQGENGERVDTPTRPSSKAGAEKPGFASAISIVRPLLPPPTTTTAFQPIRPMIQHNATTSSSTPLRPAAFRAPASIVRPVPTPFRPPPPTSTNAIASSSTPLRAPIYPPRHSTPAGSSNVPTSTPVTLRRVGIGLGMTPRTKGKGGAAKRPAFSTPFKKGHENGVGTLFSVNGKGKERDIPGTASAVKGKGKRVDKEYRKVFDLTPPEGRRSMATTYLRPEFYSPQELRDMDIPEEIWEINSSNAAYYSFCDTTDRTRNLDHSIALVELTAAGCEGLTPAWVENHWALVLWKLACLVRSKPSFFQEEKFSWEEMLKQLKYRYEREHNQGHRSAIQRIQEQDSPASLSMVLCVSSIQWLKAPVPDVGARDAPPAGTMLAAMELTDGWYRIKATSDTVLSSAVTRGKLRVGCKIGLSGVRLDAKEGGTPVLKALDSSSLTLTANTTSLLPWDTKLGFHPRPFIACLSSLSAEGGLVPVMDIVVEKCFPLAFVDGYDAKPGDTAPRPVQISRSEADEMKEVEKWERTNNLERRKIHSEIEKKMEAFLTLTERVERAAGRAKSENSAADSSEDIYWDLDDAEDKTAFLKNLDASVLPGLARFMKQKYIEDGNTMQQQIEDEISNRCPPRNVRSMRVVRIRDFKTSKPAIRTAQLTFWDAADQGEDGGLVEGKRYLVTNLMPSQRGSWAMGGQSGEIYLSSRRDSKWQQMN